CRQDLRRPARAIKSSPFARGGGKMRNDFLLEVGCEEIPAHDLAPVCRVLREKVQQGLTEHRLAYASVDVYATPRRLTLLIRQLADRQSDIEKQARGPSKAAAFDELGRPTRAAEGFARSQGVDVASLQLLETGSGPYLFATRSQTG